MTKVKFTESQINKLMNSVVDKEKLKAIPSNEIPKSTKFSESQLNEMINNVIGKARDGKARDGKCKDCTGSPISEAEVDELVVGIITELKVIVEQQQEQGFLSNITGKTMEVFTQWVISKVMEMIKPGMKDKWIAIFLNRAFSILYQRMNRDFKLLFHLIKGGATNSEYCQVITWGLSRAACETLIIKTFGKKGQSNGNNDFADFINFNLGSMTIEGLNKLICDYIVKSPGIHEGLKYLCGKLSNAVTEYSGLSMFSPSKVTTDEY